MKKLYIVQISKDDVHFNIRTIYSTEKIHVGSYIPDEVWFGEKIPGGIVTAVYK